MYDEKKRDFVLNCDEVTSLANGRKIEVIKSVRERYNLGLLEAKVIVDAAQKKIVMMPITISADVIRLERLKAELAAYCQTTNTSDYAAFKDHIYDLIDRTNDLQF